MTEKWAPMTERQRKAVGTRRVKLEKLNRRGSNVWRPCIGCFSGIRKWDQGSDYCGRCLRRDRG